MREGYSCSSCRLATYCFPPGINNSHLHLLNELVNQQTILHRNEYVYRTSETFRKIFIIRSGSVKTYKMNSHGEMIITGFYYPGEILGFDAIASKTYQENAIALDTLSLCELNFDELEKLSSKFPSYQHQLIKLMSEKISTNFFLNLSSSAESKIAFFLLTISNKMKNYGTSGINFSLSMTREDIARYLGLATETVSRIFSKLQLNNILECSKKNIIVKNYSQLECLAAQAT